MHCHGAGLPWLVQCSRQKQLIHLLIFDVLMQIMTMAEDLEEEISSGKYINSHGNQHVRSLTPASHAQLHKYNFQVFSKQRVHEGQHLKEVCDVCRIRSS